MKKAALFVGVLMLAAVLVSCAAQIGTGNPPLGPPPFLVLISSVAGLSSPVGFEIAPNDPFSRLFIVEKNGRIRVVRNGALQPSSFLDVSSQTGFASGGEMGLLGLAFPTTYITDGKFYVYYTRITGGTQRQSVIAQFQANPPTSDSANPNPLQTMVIDQPAADNHKGGQLAFGPDGYLYIALGDGGGSATAPSNPAQRLDSKLGKILRVDVDPFATPADNPFVDDAGAQGDIWAYGFRNPWRFSFDRANGRLFVGDVGQNSREEVNLVTKGGNFGWNVMEGSLCFNPTNCSMTGLTLPINEYDHSSAGGSSIIGGFVYRGTAMPGLVGTYLFGDLSSGHVWGLKQDSSGSWVRTLMLDHTRTVSAFGQDAGGELYLVDYGNGEIFKFVAAP